MADLLLMRRILVAVDGSPHSMYACRYAAAIARRFGAALTALHVAKPEGLGSFDRAERALQLEEAARTYGQQVLSEARTIAGPAVSFTAELIFGDPAEVICWRARELPADLVILGPRGLGPIEQLLQGSVSLAVVQRAPCSVLVARATESQPG